MKLLELLAKFCAILAGVLLTGITLMTCASLIGRNTVGTTLVGDFELTGVATGAAIALFMPWCQLQHGNIIVDFFTSRMNKSFNERLDRLGALLLALVFVLMTWRTTHGALNAYLTGSETQIMGVATWYTYAAMLPPFVLTALIGFWQAFRGFGDAPEAHA